jgi:hypothetical protein
MLINKKNLEGKYYLNDIPNNMGTYLLIESAMPYGSSHILTLVSEGKKIKKEVKNDDIIKGDVKLKDLEYVEKKGLKWEMPKDLLKKSVEEIAKFMLDSMDMETAKKRLSFYQDRESMENKGKIADVKIHMEKMKEESNKIGVSVDEILEFINDNKELPVADIFKGIQALINTSKKEIPINHGDNDTSPERVGSEPQQQDEDANIEKEENKEKKTKKD